MITSGHGSSSYNGTGFSGGASFVPDVAIPGFMSGGMGDSGIPAPFDMTSDNNNNPKVGDGVIFVGSDKQMDVTGLSVSRTFSGTVYIKLQWDTSGQYTATLVTQNGSTAPTQQDRTVFRPLYRFASGRPDMDYRHAPVFVMYN